jgi:hypothetical protein
MDEPRTHHPVVTAIASALLLAIGAAVTWLALWLLAPAEGEPTTADPPTVTLPVDAQPGS